MPDIKPAQGDQVQIQIYPTPTSPLQFILATVSGYQDDKVFVRLKGVPELSGELDNFNDEYQWDHKLSKWVAKSTVAVPPISRAGETVHPVSAPPSQ